MLKHSISGHYWSVCILFVLCVSSVCSVDIKLLQKNLVQNVSDSFAEISLAAKDEDKQALLVQNVNDSLAEISLAAKASDKQALLQMPAQEFINLVQIVNDSLAEISLAQEAQDKKALLQEDAQDFNNALKIFKNGAEYFIRALAEKTDAQENATAPCKLSVNTRCGASYGSCGVANTYCSYWGWCKAGTYTTNHMAIYNYRAECATPCDVTTTTQCGQGHGSCSVAGTYCSTYGWCGVGSKYMDRAQNAYNYKTACAAPAEESKDQKLSKADKKGLKKLAKKLGKNKNVKKAINTVANKIASKIPHKAINGVVNKIVSKIPVRQMASTVARVAGRVIARIPVSPTLLARAGGLLWDLGRIVRAAVIIL